MCLLKGRPFHEKYADVKWETNAAHLKAWKEGKTGVPIVDAVRLSLRCFHIVLIGADCVGIATSKYPRMDA